MSSTYSNLRLRQGQLKAIPPYTCPQVDAAIKALSNHRQEAEALVGRAESMDALVMSTDAEIPVDIISASDGIFSALQNHLPSFEEVNDQFEHVRRANSDLRDAANDRDALLEEALDALERAEEKLENIRQELDA